MRRIGKRLLAAVVMFFALITLLLFFMLRATSSKTSLTVAGPLSQNLSNGDIVDDGVVFFSGSAFGKYSLEEGQASALSGYLTMPAVIRAEYLDEDTAIIETSNHRPGSEIFSLLFNDPETIDRIDRNYFWFVDIPTATFTRASSLVDGNINSIGRGEDIYFSSLQSNGATTQTHIYKGAAGSIERIYTVNGDYRLVSSNDGFSVLLGDGYQLLDHSNGLVGAIPGNLISAPLILSNGDVVALLATEGTTATDPSTISHDHEDDVDGVYRIAKDLQSSEKISESKGGVFKFNNEDIVGIVSESSEKETIIDTLELNEDQDFDSARLILDRLPVGVQEATRTNRGIVFIDILGDLYVASEDNRGQNLTPSAVVRPDQFCGVEFCIDPIGPRSASVSIYSGEIEEIKIDALEQFNLQGINPLYIDINWVDQRAL